MPFWCKTAVASAVSLLAACALLEPEREPVPRAAAFDLVGRVAVTYDGRVFSSTIRWQHTAERDEIWLLTPVGQALAHIVGDAGGATYTGADRSRHRARDVASLARRALGWEFPVAQLAWWVRGELAPATVIQAVERDDRGRLTALAQEGWRITYDYDHASGETPARPRRLDIAYGTQQVRLVIDGWR